MDAWQIGLWIYLTLAVFTFLPAFVALVRPVKLNPGGPSFSESPNLSEAAKVRLAQNYERLQGTLSFWKTQAERFRRLYVYSLLWITISVAIVPVLAQSISGNNDWSRALLTAVSIHTAILLGVLRGFRVEANYRAFRNGESDFYDLYRRFLDRPEVFGETETEQVRRYLEQVELVRRVVRSAETDNLPSIEEIETAR